MPDFDDPASGNTNGNTNGDTTGDTTGGPAVYLDAGDDASMPFTGWLDSVPAPLLLPSRETRYPIDWWDPMLRAQLVLGEFGATCWPGLQRSIKVNAPDNGEANMRPMIEALRDYRARLRDRRRDEIVGQVDALAEYFYQLLGCDGRRNATATLVQVGIAVGQMVGMFFKAKFARPRPVQFYPALLTVVPTPAHPSYPNNHALQSRLVQHCVLAAMGQVGRPALVRGWGPVLEAMAWRIAENRMVAGVHFPDDTVAGRCIADQVIDCLAGLETFKELVAEGATEWQGWNPGPAPEAMPGMDVDPAATAAIAKGATS
jgi:membrane-associated phospholipid phosphatase